MKSHVTIATVFKYDISTIHADRIAVFKSFIYARK